MQANEIWKAIPGCEGRYEVSSLGRVRSLLKGGRILRAAQNARGYLMVAPVVDGANKVMRVHQVVLAAFVGPRPPGMVACHNNGIASDNAVANLRWDTPAANVQDRINSGRYHKNQKLTAEKALAIREDQRGNEQIAKDYGVDGATVRNIKRGVNWKHIPLSQ
jgi:hypothetical protein